MSPISKFVRAETAFIRADEGIAFGNLKLLSKCVLVNKYNRSHCFLNFTSTIPSTQNWYLSRLTVVVFSLVIKTCEHYI